VVVSRRCFLGSCAASACWAAGKGQIYPTEARRFADQATDLEVVRLTDPAHRSWLPAYSGRAISKHAGFLIYASDRSGTEQAYRLDLKNGQSHTLTEANNLVPDSLSLTPDERGFCYLDGDALMLGNFSGLRTREVYRLAAGFEAGRGFRLSEDALYAALVEQKAGASRVRLITMRTGGAETLAESPSDPLSDPMPRPKRAGLLYRRGNDELWVVNFDGAQNRKLRIAPGGTGPAFWSADGRAVLYLNYPSDKKQLHNVREFIPDTNEDRLVGNTSQFVAFGGNGDSSVFVGASGSKASPYVLLLVRSVKRELTLCEHRASDPGLSNPMFSPNSQRIFFQSDRDGKMAIYAMVVEKLVAETETEER
jgi:oligogalacturonide lyase